MAWRGNYLRGSPIHQTGPLRPIILPDTRIFSPFQRRFLQKQSLPSTSKSPNFAFAFDIDGVLLRSSAPLPNAGHTLRTLQANHIPFILLTNGGGTGEQARVTQLSRLLEAPITTSQFIQSHTPFSDFTHLSDKTALVMGGPKDGHSCREVARSYGFGTVITPMDIYAAYPDIWPFGMPVDRLDADAIRPLPKPLAFEVKDELDKERFLKIDAAFVFNDPRDWSTDATILLDTLLSHQGFVGTISPKNGDKRLKNRGYQQDGQPPIYFSNPDVWWAAKWQHPRLGQGAFRAAFEGLFKTATDGAELLQAEQWGKPCRLTYEFAEKRLVEQGERDASELTRIEKVYMVGDNPESDIRGANEFKSNLGIEWRSTLVQTGVFSGGEPAHKPKTITKGVWEAVQHAFEENGFKPKQS